MLFSKYILIYLSLVSLSLQGDLLKCLDDGNTLVGEAALLIKDISEKAGIIQIANDIIAITQSIGKMIEDCNNPIPLDMAMKRCLNENPTTGCEQYGAIIYPKCKNDFYNAGCCICSHNCPSGFRDDGLYCGKPGPYGRGAGYPWKFGDDLSLKEATRRCENENPELGCEQWLLFN